MCVCIYIERERGRERERERESGAEEVVYDCVYIEWRFSISDVAF